MIDTTYYLWAKESPSDYPGIKVGDYDETVAIKTFHTAGHKGKDPILTINYPGTVFIGESPMNELTKTFKTFGPEYNGSSILVQTDKGKYTYIGSEIYSFSSSSEIVKFVSPIGNNWVPYPWAEDFEGNFYLLLEKTFIKNKKEREIDLQTLDNPYTWFFSCCNKKNCTNNYILDCFGDWKSTIIKWNKKHINEKGKKTSISKSERRSPHWNSDPYALFDFITKSNTRKIYFEVSTEFGKALEQITRTKYVNTLISIGDKMGFYCLREFKPLFGRPRMFF
jgi:hypothetical protein